MTTVNSLSESVDARVARCPTCCSEQSCTQLFAAQALPVFCNVLWSSREEALAAPRGPIRLVCCRKCGQIFNDRFEPGRLHYNSAYENSLHFSPGFQRFAQDLAQRLVQTYHLRQRNIVEIGCGRGDFLRLLCAAGDNRGLGFDPSHSATEAASLTAGSLTIVAEPFPEDTFACPVDLVVCRHVLEHLPDPLTFLRKLRQSLAQQPACTLYFEVPNVRYTLENVALWDIIYEHYNYYSPASLAHLFRQAGFAVLAVHEGFSGQFVSIEARPAGADASLPTLAESEPHLLQRFHGAALMKTGYWRCKIALLRRSHRRAALWGAGSKGVTFLNAVAADDPPVACAVDLNPHKHQRHIAGTGQIIVPPSALKQIRPDLVIIMNPNYREEIQQQLAQLQLTPQVLVA